MRAALALFAIATLALAQSGVERQRAAIERQRHGFAPATGAVSRQMATIERQRAHAMHASPSDAQPFAAWSATPLVPMPPTMSMEQEPLQAPAPVCPSLDLRQARERFRAEETLNSLPPGLLMAVAGQESAFSPCAVSRTGAMGLMQLMPGTAQDLGVANPFDPWQSLRGGGQFLRQLLDRYGGDLSLALGAYNAGPSNVDRYGGVPPFAETQNYVAGVLTRLQKQQSTPAKPALGPVATPEPATASETPAKP